MNPFTTDHPLASQPSWFDTKAHPMMSFFCSGLVLAPVLFLVLCGWVLLPGLVDEMLDDDGIVTVFPDSLGDLLGGMALVWVFSLFCAFLLVSSQRLILNFIRKHRDKRKMPVGESQGG
jgi:threonine/homoserine/homoserine lactone efflux protein